jgi:hypothetical protein
VSTALCDFLRLLVSRRIGLFSVGFLVAAIECDLPSREAIQRTVRLEWSYDFGRKEINSVQDLVEQHRAELLESWHEFFDS